MMYKLIFNRKSSQNFLEPKISVRQKKFFKNLWAVIVVNVFCLICGVFVCGEQFVVFVLCQGCWSIYRIFVLQNQEWSKKTRELFSDKNCNVLQKNYRGVDTRGRDTRVRFRYGEFWMCSLESIGHEEKSIEIELFQQAIHDKYRLFSTFFHGGSLRLLLLCN